MRTEVDPKTPTLNRLSRRRFLQITAAAVALPLVANLGTIANAAAPIEGYLDYVEDSAPCEVSGRAHIPGNPTTLSVRVDFRSNAQPDIVEYSVTTLANGEKHIRDGRPVAWGVAPPRVLGGFKGHVTAYALVDGGEQQLPIWDSQWTRGDSVNCQDQIDWFNPQSTDLGNGLSVETRGIVPLLNRFEQGIAGASPDGFASLIQTFQGRYIYTSGLVNGRGQTAFASFLGQEALTGESFREGIIHRNDQLQAIMPPIPRQDNGGYQAGASAIVDSEGLVHIFGHKERKIGNLVGVSDGYGLVHATSNNGIDFTEPEIFLQPGYTADQSKPAGQGLFHPKLLPISPDQVDRDEALIFFDNWTPNHKDGGMVAGIINLKDPHNSLRFWKEGSFSSKDHNQSILVPRVSYGQNLWHMGPTWLSDGRLLVTLTNFMDDRDPLVGNIGKINMMVSDRTLTNSSLEEVVGSLRNAPVFPVMSTPGVGYRYGTVFGPETSHLLDYNKPANLLVAYHGERPGVNSMPALVEIVLHK